MNSESDKKRQAVESLAADLYRESQKVKGSGKKPATWEQAKARAREVAIRHDRNNR
jgi:hypothetical protein